MHRPTPPQTTAIVLALAIGCGGPTRQTAPAPEPVIVEGDTAVEVVTARHVKLADVGLDAEAMDRSADPCADFYQFACGGWLARTEIPSDEARWGRFSEINKRTEEALRGILEEAAQGQATDPVSGPIGALYASCMDEATIEGLGVKPIQPLLARVAKAKNAAALGELIVELHRNGIQVPFTLDADADFKDPGLAILHLDQGGLGLPDRDQYLTDDAKSKELRKAYRAHVERMLRLGGLNKREARKAADDVLTIETALARVSKTRVERRDPKGIYNRVDRAGLRQSAPKVPWDTLFERLGHGALEQVSVTSVPFFAGLDRALGEIKPSAWQSYLRWQILHATAPYLGKKLVAEDFALTQAITGQAELEPRWKRCVRVTDESLGDLLAQKYVERHFGPDAKGAVERMIGFVREALRQDVITLAWMDDGTRTRALGKLDAVSFKIGYPSRWETYDFKVERRTFAANVLAARAARLRRELGKVGKPVDREEWEMSAPTVNAYYNPLKNEMVFPAGILQSPFFSATAAEAVNLGAIGYVVAHELTHGFDDQGSQFGANGSLEAWWEPAVRERFMAKAQCLVEQYGQYEAVPGVRLNGQLTLGENIADLAGVKLSYRAFRLARADAAEAVYADDFTEDQQFFLAVGQAWCSKDREELARTLAVVDPHSPPRLRVNGVLVNLPEFAEAFSCAPEAAMRSATTCEVW